MPNKFWYSVSIFYQNKTRAHVAFIKATPKWIVPAGLLCALWAIYLSLFLSYRAYDIDNPWFLSFSHDACLGQVVSDQFLDIRFPAGMDGTQFFGKTAASLQCVALSHTGWQQYPAMLLGSGFVTSALALWWIQLRKVGYTRRFVLFFVGALGLSEPMLAAAERFRYEPFSFLLMSLGLLAASYRKVFWAFLSAGLAVEVEPAAIAGLIPVFFLCWYSEKERRSLLLNGASGLFSALAIYIFLHHDAIHSMQYLAGSRTSTQTAFGGYFVAYFFQRLRHLPELLIFAAGAALYWRRRKSIENHYLAVSAVLVMALALAMPHGNPAYMIFLWPLLLGTALQAFRIEDHPAMGIAVITLYFFPQYATLTLLNRGQGYRVQDIAIASHAIQDAGRILKIDDDQLRVYGDYSLWFAHPNRYRAAAISTLAEIHNADVYVCYERAIEKVDFAPADMLHCPQLRRLVPLQLIETTSIRGNMLQVYIRR